MAWGSIGKLTIYREILLSASTTLHTLQYICNTTITATKYCAQYILAVPPAAKYCTQDIHVGSPSSSIVHKIYTRTCRQSLQQLSIVHCIKAMHPAL